MHRMISWEIICTLFSRLKSLHPGSTVKVRTNPNEEGGEWTKRARGAKGHDERPRGLSNLANWLGGLATWKEMENVLMQLVFTTCIEVLDLQLCPVLGIPYSHQHHQNAMM